jgi:hypothetical protein
MPPILLSEEDQRRLQDLLNWVSHFSGPGVINTPRGPVLTPVRTRKQRPQRQSRSSKIPAVITGSTAMSGESNRWKYAWSEIDPDGDGVSVKTDGRSGTTTDGYAVNLAEVYHTSTYAWGVDVTGTDYQSNFSAMPVGGGGTSTTHKYNVPVEITHWIDSEGVDRYYFFATGSHDGTCDT